MVTPPIVCCPSCNEPMDTALTRLGWGLHPTCPPLPSVPSALAEDAVRMTVEAANNSPRSRQTRIGPSELGTPCDRQLALKLAEYPAVNPDASSSWPAIVGTAVHERIADAVAAVEANRDPSTPPRWHVEERVVVGEVDGTPITGSCDLFDGYTGTVLDWKVVHSSTARSKADNPGEQYRVQAHLYGRGFAQRGFPVQHVAVAFLGRDGGTPHVWTEPYDEKVATDALDRATQLARSNALIGVEQTANLLDTAWNYCQGCPFYAPDSQDPCACAGEKQQPDALASQLK